MILNIKDDKKLKKYLNKQIILTKGLMNIY